MGLREMSFQNIWHKYITAYNKIRHSANICKGF